jgi:hypothetical protein
MASEDLALGFEALGRGLNLAGTLFGSEQSAQRAELNQALARREAETTRRLGDLEAERLERQEDDVLGRTRAAFAARGVDSRGTPTEVLADQAATLERRQALQEFQTETAAETRSFEARRAGQRASAVRTSGLIEAGTTLATGLSSLASKGAFEGMFNSGPDLQGEISPDTGFT